ncbi:MAG: hypothetical protein ACR2FE_11195 [Aeromicrobium sp.]
MSSAVDLCRHDELDAPQVKGLRGARRPEVTILTYEHRDDYVAGRAGLRERGAMIDGMHIANVWEDLRGWDDVQLKQAAAEFSPGAESSFEPLGERGDRASPLVNTLHDEDDDSVVQVDYFRADWTLLGSDPARCPATSLAHSRCATRPELRSAPGCRSGTSTTSGSTHSRATRSRGQSATPRPRQPSRRYHRDDVVTIHLVHGSHLVPGSGRPMGELSKDCKRVMERLDQWDGVVFLTQQQLDEVDALLGPGTSRHVIPHGRHVPSEPPNLKRSSSAP